MGALRALAPFTSLHSPPLLPPSPPHTPTHVTHQSWKIEVLEVTAVESLEAVMALRPVTYLWNEEAPNADKASRELGFIAQEVRDVLLEPLQSAIVRPVDGDGHIGLTYSKFSALLTGALQEQQRMIDELKESLRLQQDLVDEQQKQLELHEERIRLAKLEKDELRRSLDLHREKIDSLEVSSGR